MKPKHHLILILLMVLTDSAFAQDTLFYRNGSTQIVKVMEVGTDEVKYRDWKTPDAPQFSVLKDDLKKIGFIDGNQLRFEEDMLSVAPNYEAAKKTHAIKVNFLSPLFNHLCFGYEGLVKKGMSTEFKLGIIGVGNDNVEEQYSNTSGAYFKAGVKFINTPNYVVKGMKRTHPLRGGYIKPEIIYSVFEKTVATNSGSWNAPQQFETGTFHNYAFNLVFGKQWIMGDIVTLDLSFGIGYGGQSTTVNYKEMDGESYFEEQAYSHVYAGPDFPMIFNSALTIGVLF
jgi:hypothetical protein